MLAVNLTKSCHFRAVILVEESLTTFCFDERRKIGNLVAWCKRMHQLTREVVAGEIHIRQIARYSCAQYLLLTFIVANCGRKKVDLDIWIILHKFIGQRLMKFREARQIVKHVEVTSAAAATFGVTSETAARPINMPFKTVRRLIVIIVSRGLLGGRWRREADRDYFTPVMVMPAMKCLRARRKQTTIGAVIMVAPAISAP